jgi:hypothetical protein
MSSSKILPVIQILVVVVAVGAIAIGALKLFTPRVSDEADTPLGSDAEPTEMDEPEAQEEAPPSPAEEPGEPASEAETKHETGETIVEPCLVRVEALNLSREMVYAGEAVEAIVLLRNLGSECVYDFELRVSGGYEASKEVALAANETMQIGFDVVREEQGGYYVYAGNLSDMFYVNRAGFEIISLNIHPASIAPREPVWISVEVYNPNHVEVTDSIRFTIDEGDIFDRGATIGSQKTQTVEINTTYTDPGSYFVRVGDQSGFFEVVAEEGEEPEEPEPTRPEPTFYWSPDPATDNFTNILPPEASPVRLSLPASVEDIFFTWEAGAGAYGLHAGGHIEGLDHVWIEIRDGIPVGSWANGTVTDLRYSGDVEHGEYHITIDYGKNLTGTHMEIATPLVEVGDYVERGQAVGYGMGFFSGLQSAEIGIVDRGRRDGIWGGNGVNVSPYDYLREEEKQTLVEAYKAHTVEKYGKDQRITWLFDASQPYLTNPLLIHEGNEGRLTGEWYLVSHPWEPGWPNDMLVLIEADNAWYTGNRVLANDDTDEDSQPRNIDGTFEVDYERGRILIYNQKYGGILFGIFEVDETGERALLRIEFHEYRHPEEFTEDVLVYTERTNLGRRWDAVELGVLDSW